MPEQKLKQLQYESDTWKRLLAFLKDENVYLKNRLSEILKNGFETNLLDEIELFQTRFIKEDEMISSLQTDISELDKLLVREIFEDGRIMKKVKKRIKQLKAEMKTAETQFRKMKQEFINYLSENILES